MKHVLSLLMIASLLGSFALSAKAAPQPLEPVPCSSLPNPLYVQSGDTQQPLLKELGRQLRDSATHNMTVIHLTAGTCTNVEAFYGDIPVTVNMSYVPSSAEAPDWTPLDPPWTCTVPPQGQALDVAIAATFISSCRLTKPANVHEIRGPIQAYVMAVPEASSQVALTAQEAYFAFGFGQAGQAQPWIDPQLYFIRPITKSTILTWAAAIAVPAERWFGTRFDKSSEVIDKLVQAGTPQAAIGILGAEVYDLKRDVLNSLAFRAFGQTKAYYPDSSATAFDKQNLRDGHYTVWSPTEYMIRVDPAGHPVNPNALLLVDLVLGTELTPKPDFNSLSTVIGKGLVPDCAMKVTRAFEGGELSLYTPSEPCGCYFDSVVGQTSCTACQQNTDCGGSAEMICKFGYCERSNP